MRTSAVFTLIAFVCCFLVLPANANTVTFEDSTFNDSDWSAELGFVNASSVSFTGQQIGAGGNPGPFRQTTHDWTGPGGLNVLHLNANAIFDPSVSGAISTIDYSFDLNWINAPSGPGGVSYRVLLFQNGTYYSGGQELVQQSGWSNFDDMGLVVTDFVRHEPIGTGGINPDFSATGSTIQLGYLSSNGTSFAQAFTTVSGIDNWSVDVNTVAVPEPTSLLVILMAMLGAWASRKHARRFPIHIC